MPSTGRTVALTVERPESKTAPARAVRLTQSAHRAAANRIELARALRIVRAGLATQRLTLAELTPLPPMSNEGDAG
jgi:hypothetical protein